MSDKSEKSNKNTSSQMEHEELPSNQKKYDNKKLKISSQALGFYSYMYFKMKAHQEKDGLSVQELLPLYTAQTKEQQIPTRDAIVVQKQIFPFSFQENEIQLREYASRDWGFRYNEDILL